MAVNDNGLIYAKVKNEIFYTWHLFHTSCIMNMHLGIWNEEQHRIKHKLLIARLFYENRSKAIVLSRWNNTIAHSQEFEMKCIHHFQWFLRQFPPQTPNKDDNIGCVYKRKSLLLKMKYTYVWINWGLNHIHTTSCSILYLIRLSLCTHLLIMSAKISRFEPNNTHNTSFTVPLNNWPTCWKVP